MYNTDSMNALNGWKQNLNELYQLHYQAAQRYAKRAEIISYFIILLQALSTALSVGGISNLEYAGIIFGIVLGLNSTGIFFNTLEKQFGWKTLTEKYENQAKSYRKAYMMIEKNIILQKTDIELLINDIIKFYQSIEENAILLPKDLSPKQSLCRNNFVNSVVNYRKNISDIENTPHVSLST